MCDLGPANRKAKVRNVQVMKNKVYPIWSCWGCGVEHGTKKNFVASWHYGKCDVCGKNNNVTEPRDFGHFKNWFAKPIKKNNKKKL